ncbi:hypothetical protein [Sulfuricurvum sp.]|nr:hypothetical protein [Sulfuricurvum sp.]MDD2781340.1 hypothetical protein [Sulfuricurvum sp.]MDD3597575.1 hypothetical protein [Sulfuricurvum sp.]
MTQEEMKEEEYFEERGGKIVGENPPLWIKLLGGILYPLFWILDKLKK